MGIDLASLQEITYFGIFVLFLFSSLVPVPEEAVLLFVGYGAAIGWAAVLPASLMAFLGMLAGDIMLFYISSHGSKYIDKVLAKANQSKILKYRLVIEENSKRAVFVSRFMSGLRFYAIILAGTFGVKLKTFALYDFLALLIYTPILIFLGYHFHGQFTALITKADEVRNVITIVSFTLLGTFIYFIARCFFTKESKAKS